MSLIKKHLLITTLAGISAINAAFAQTSECNFPITSEQMQNRAHLKIFSDQDFNKYKPGTRRFIRLLNKYKPGTKHKSRPRVLIRLPNDVSISLRSRGEKGYTETVMQLASSYKCYNVFDKKGQLISSSHYFFDDRIGFTTEYDGKGNIIKQTNEDKDYPFSISQLVEKMKYEFNIDILYKQKGIPETFVMRSIDEERTNKPYYEVYKTYNGYLIDGTTGELLFQMDARQLVPGERHLTVLGYYLESLDAQQTPNSTNH